MGAFFQSEDQFFQPNQYRSSQKIMGMWMFLKSIEAKKKCFNIV